MIKRVKATKVGDIFEVKISESEKKYMQYIASDLTCLNSDVVRGFSKAYPINEKPTLEEIVSDKVDFYAHCDSKAGIKMEKWTLYGNTDIVGDVKNIIFMVSRDNGSVLSDQWYIWHINEEMQWVSRNSKLLRSASYGGVFPHKMIYERIKNGFFNMVYPRYE